MVCTFEDTKTCDLQDVPNQSDHWVLNRGHGNSIDNTLNLGKYNIMLIVYASSKDNHFDCLTNFNTFISPFTLFDIKHELFCRICRVKIKQDVELKIKL